MFNLFIVDVLLAYPVGVIFSQSEPDPVSQIRSKLSIWMKTIARFNHAFWITSLHHLLLQDLHRWKIIILGVEIFVSMLVKNFLIDFTKIFSSISCKFSDSFITVEPSPARTYLEAIQKFIHLTIGDVQRMGVIVQILVKHISIP